MPLTRNMLDLDPPDHTRLQTLVQKAFTPRPVEQLRERIQALTDDLLDAVQAKGKMDLIRDYALPIPTTIIAEMLGVPAGERHKFQLLARDGIIQPVRVGDVESNPDCHRFHEVHPKTNQDAAG